MDQKGETDVIVNKIICFVRKIRHSNASLARNYIELQ